MGFIFLPEENRLLSKFALIDKISKNFESMCHHMLEKFYDKDAKKGNFNNRMEFRKKSNK